MKIISNNNVKNTKRFCEFHSGDTFIFGKDYYMKLNLAALPPFPCDNCDSYINIEGYCAVNLETGVVREFVYTDTFEPCTCSIIVDDKKGE